MLPDVGGTELVLIAAVALIVVGPKDLPMLMRKVGQFVGRMRAMASEFRSSFDDMARQSELDDLRKEIEAMRGERLDPVEWTESALKENEPEAWHDAQPEIVFPEPSAAPVKPKRARAKAPSVTSAPAAEGQASGSVRKRVRKAAAPIDAEGAPKPARARKAAAPKAAP